MKKYVQKTTSLRLLIKYDKHKETDSVILTFNVLQDKGRQKARYIMNAIEHADAHNGVSEAERDFLFTIRCFRFLKLYFNLKSKESIEELLEGGLESSAFKVSEEKMLGSEEPRTSLLGFNKSIPEEIKMHDRLFQLEPTDRIALICNSVEKYVKDGMDNEALTRIAFRSMHELFIQYDQSKNKSEVVQNVYDIIQMAEKYKDLY